VVDSPTRHQLDHPQNSGKGLIEILDGEGKNHILTFSQRMPSLYQWLRGSELLQYGSHFLAHPVITGEWNLDWRSGRKSLCNTLLS